MRGRLLVVLLIALLLASFAAASPITVKTDKSQYYPGETVTITGKTTPNVRVGIQVKDPKGSTVWIDSVTSGGDGRFTSKFKLPRDAVTGTYTVYATSPEGKATCTFKVVKKPAPPPPPPPPPAPPEERARRLIAELEDKLDKVRELLDTLSKIIDVKEYYDRLDKIEEMLGNAKSAFDAGDYDKAVDIASRALDKLDGLWREAADKALDAVKSLISELRATGIEELGTLADMAARLVEKGYVSLDEAISFFKDTAATVGVGKAYLEQLKKIEELKAAASKLEEEKSKLEELKAALEKKLAALEAKVKEYEERAKAYEELKGRYEALKEEYEKAKAERDELTRRIGRLEGKISELEKELASAATMLIIAAVIALVAGVAAGVFIGKKILG